MTKCVVDDHILKLAILVLKESEEGKDIAASLLDSMRTIPQSQFLEMEKKSKYYDTLKDKIELHYHSGEVSLNLDLYFQMYLEEGVNIEQLLDLIIESESSTKH